MYKCKILADSVNAKTGDRLTTVELTYPRFVHAELLTHRAFSRNAASSRAIPIKKMREQIINNPVIPVWFGKAQKGMQANEELKGWRLWLAKQLWLKSRYVACFISWIMEKIGMHKQIPNRILEPWMWITIILTATDYGNALNLRCHPDAQPEIKVAFELLREELADSIPAILQVGDWHLPLIFPEDLESYTNGELELEDLIKLSVGRCARVSYLTHDGRRDPEADIKLYNRLLTSGHMSPFEHIAQAADESKYYGNFRGWNQHRKMISNENRSEYVFNVKEV